MPLARNVWKQSQSSGAARKIARIVASRDVRNENINAAGSKMGTGRMGCKEF